MAPYRLKRYLGIVFIGVVIVPAVVLSFIAIRAISHEEAYIEKQIEGTLSAEVTHVAAIVQSELAEIRAELAGTLVIPTGDDPSGPLEEWRRASKLVDVPFLLSPTYEILWPAAAPGREADEEVSDAEDAVEDARGSDEAIIKEKETIFLENQQAFLSDEETTPVYENIAVAYKDEILDGRAPTGGEIAGIVGSITRPLMESEAKSEAAGEYAEHARTEAPATEERLVDTDSTPGGDTYADGRYGLSKGRASEDLRVDGVPDEQASQTWTAPENLVGREAPSTETPADPTRSDGVSSYQLERQSAISRFVENESVRKKVYEKAEREGQQVLYRNVAPTDQDESGAMAGMEDLDIGADTKQESPSVRPEELTAADRASVAELDASQQDEPTDKPTQPARTGVPKSTPTRAEATRESVARGRIRSVFISEPLSLSEIVAGGERGIVPRMIDGNLQLLYWQQAEEGNIVGCLVDSREVRERIIGTLPGIYSTVRILTVLDELGHPVIVPPGHEDRDWRRPFVAEEISEMLPRWEIAAYLTDPNIISSRAQVATSVMWILILFLFVSIVGGGVLVVRSTYAEMRLAQQKTTFVANVSHELKTPLTSIRMFAEMLRDGRQPDREKQKQYLDIMTSETERLTRLVNNVLDFSRMERGEKRYTMRVTDLVALASGVVASQRARLEHGGFEVSFNTRTGPVRVNADEEALKQALVNLLSNAEKYSAEATRIEVSVRQEAGSAVISVSDRGVGVPATEAGRIFDEFYRADDTLTSKVKGAGLGLTIARRILRDHGGDIRLRSREGGGSTFEIVLPVAGGKT